MKINIQKEVNINAKGVHGSYNNKFVLCIDTGEFYVSLRDAAATFHIDPGALSRAIAQKRVCKGHRFCFVSKMSEDYEAIAEIIRINAEKAKAYDEIIGRQKAIEKAEDDIRKGEVRLEQLRQQTKCVEEMLEEAKRRLNELKGETV